MDNIITGVIGMGIFLLFVGGLAESIGQFPFTVIVIIVGAMTAYGLYEDVREDQKRQQDQ